MGILITERKILKRILGVKSGTSNDLIYQELNFPDMKAVILNRQYIFFTKVMNIPDDEAIVKEIWQMYESSQTVKDPDNLISYYSSLQLDATKQVIATRKIRIETSNDTMCLRYKDLTNMARPLILYSSMINDVQLLLDGDSPVINCTSKLEDTNLHLYREKLVRV